MDKVDLSLCSPSRKKSQQAKPAIPLSDCGVPILKPGAINVYAILPCPLKVRFKTEMEQFIKANNSSDAIEVYCPTILDGSPKAIEERMRKATFEDELPDVLVTTSLSTILAKEFKDKFLNTGIFHGITNDKFNLFLPDEYKRISKQHNLGFLAFGSWSLIWDQSLGTDAEYPHSWTDLTKPQFKDQLSIHGYNGKVSGTSLLLVLKEKMGNEAISRFAGNIKTVKHFAEVIKGISSTNQERARFNILPNAASSQMPSNKAAAMLEFQDGPLMHPLLIFVKKSRLTECRHVLDFFWGEGFRNVLRKGDFHMPDEMDWQKKYTFPDWDYLVSRDYDELSDELNEEFKKGLSVDIARGLSLEGC